MPGHGPGHLLLLLALLLDLSLVSLSGARDYRGFSAHNALPPARHLRRVLWLGVDIARRQAENAIVLHHVLLILHHHVELGRIECSRILLFAGRRALEIAVYAHLAGAATRLQGRRLDHVHHGQRVEDRVLLHEGVVLLGRAKCAASQEGGLLVAGEGASPSVYAVRAAKQRPLGQDAIVSESTVRQRPAY